MLGRLHTQLKFLGHMFLVLADVQEGKAAETKVLSGRIETLEGQLAERDGRIAELEGQAAERDSELSDLRAKAASVDALADRLRRSEEESARRFDQILSAISKSEGVSRADAAGDGAQLT